MLSRSGSWNSGGISAGSMPHFPERWRSSASFQRPPCSTGMNILMLALLAQSEYTCSDGYALKYTLTEPEKIEDGKKYPLVLCLHGRGGNSTAAKVLAGA